MLTTTNRRRLSWNGLHLRLRGGWGRDRVGDVEGCWRASIAMDKAFGEVVREARDGGATWREIGRRLGVVEDANDKDEVLAAVVGARRMMYERFWGDA
jgi:hypothetical protein